MAADQNRQSRQRQDAGRMVAFSDGVVAIAITLLILPLAGIELPNSGEGASNPLVYIWNENYRLIISFLISWGVILVFWLAHHRLFGMIDKINPTIMRWNAIWLLAVVVLPFPTSLIGQVADSDAIDARFVDAFYIFDMFVMSFMLTLISHAAAKDPDTLAEDIDTRVLTKLTRGYVFAGYLGLLTLVACINGQVALYGLLGLIIIGPIVERVDALREDEWATAGTP